MQYWFNLFLVLWGQYVHTCVFECLSVKILSKYLETDAKTDEWLRVAIFPHFKITSQSGFCPFPSKLDLCCFKDASKASLKVIFSGASIWGRPSDFSSLHFWVLVFWRRGRWPRLPVWNCLVETEKKGRMALTLHKGPAWL